jgi:hypothetical protein
MERGSYIKFSATRDAGERVRDAPGLILCLPHKLTDGIADRI